MTAIVLPTPCISPTTTIVSAMQGLVVRLDNEEEVVICGSRMVDDDLMLLVSPADVNAVRADYDPDQTTEIPFFGIETIEVL